LQANRCQIAYLAHHAMHREHFFQIKNSSPQPKLSLYSDHFSLFLYLITMSELFPDPTNYLSRVRMSQALSATEKVVEEVLIDLMIKRVMSK
jgi:hypothetical protein